MPIKEFKRAPKPSGIVNFHRPQHHLDQIWETAGEGFVIENALTQHEIDELICIGDNYPKKDYKMYGNHRAYRIHEAWDSGEKYILSDKIRHWIGSDYEIYGTYAFFTEAPFNIHADSGNRQDLLPFKEIVIPLKIFQQTDDVYTVTMKQRYPHHSIDINYYPGPSRHNRYVSSEDYHEISGYQGRIEIDEDFYQSHLSNIDREVANHFQVERLLRNRPGDVIVMDSWQIHCAGTFTNRCKGKRMLSIFLGQLPK